MQETQPRICYYKPPMFDKDLARWIVDQVDDITWNGTYTNGELSQRFADAIGKRTGYEYAIPLGSGTAALIILARWFWKQGYRKLRVPAFTWPSTYKAFEWLGWKIRFVDIDRDTWLADFGDMLCDSDEMELPVDTFGSVYPGYYRLIDSAQSLGAKWDETQSTRIVSLSGSKIITTGEGGLVLTQDKELNDFVCHNSWYSRLPEMSAALGLAYLERLDDILAKKRAIKAAYKMHFKNVQWQEVPGDSNDYIVAGLVDSPKAWAKANPNVEYRFYYSGIVSEEDEFVTFEETNADSLPRLVNTEYVSRRIIAFPSWSDMSLDAIQSMVEP